MKELLLDIKSEVDKTFGNANALNLSKVIKYEEQ